MAVQPRFGQVLLAHHGILTGYRGPRGGYRLAREPSGISVEDILRSIGNKEDDSDEIATADWPLLNEVVLPTFQYDPFSRELPEAMRQRDH